MPCIEADIRRHSNLLSLLHRCFWADFTTECLSRPGEVILGEHTDNPEIRSSFFFSSIDVYGTMAKHIPILPLQFPEVHDHLLSLADVKREVDVLAPCHQVTYFLSVSGLIVVGDDRPQP